MPDAIPDGFRFDALQSVSTISADRYCESCGYNLRGQHVRRDDRTQLYMVRCPECHTFTHANQPGKRWEPWLQRLTIVLTILWLVAWAWAFVMLVFVEGAFGDEMFREAGFYSYHHHDPFGNEVPTSQQLAQRRFEQQLAYVFSMACRFGIGLGAACILAAVMWFWKRWGLWLFIILYPTIAAGINIFVLTYESRADRNLLGSPWIFFAPFAVSCILGGFIGVWIGRPLTRLLIRVFVPPAFRPYLGFLWEVDGKIPPVAKPTAAEQAIV